MKTHWTSKFECYFKGFLEKKFTGAACKGADQKPDKYKHGVKEEVDCKTCIRMRDSLKRKGKR
jgi:hypothetical protein